MRPSQNSPHRLYPSRKLSAICVAALAAFALSLVPSAPASDSPGEQLKRQFESAKAALSAGELAEAETRYRQTITLGLRQLGNLAISEDQFEQATQFFDNAVLLSPDDAGLRVDSAIAWFRRGDPDKATRLVNAVLASHPKSAPAHNVLGRIDLFKGDTEGAIQQLKQAVALQHDFETSYFLGIAYLKAKRLSEASAWYSQLESQTGDSAALHVLFGRAYTITHYPQPAIAEFLKAIKLDPKYPRAHGLLGYAYLDLYGEAAYPRARKEFEKELKLNPDDYYSLTLLGLTTVALRDFPAAKTTLLHAVRLNPNDAGPYLYLGETYVETNRTQLAVEALQKYIKLVRDPNEVPRDVSRAYYMLGRALLQLGRVDEAKKALAESQQYREAKFKYDVKHIFDEKPAASGSESHTTSDRVAGLLEASASQEQKTTEDIVQGGMRGTLAVPAPQPAPAALESKSEKQYRSFVAEILASSYNDLGVMRAKNSNFKEAAEYFKQAATWKPDLPGLDRNGGMANYRAGLYSDAIPPLARQLAAHPEDAFVRQLLGLSYFATDNFAKTAEVLHPFTEHPPDDPGVLFAWGTSLVRIHDSAHAAPIFLRLLKQNAANPQVHLLLGQAYAQQEDYPDALAELRKASELDSHLPEAHYYSGLVFLHQGKLDSAAKEFRAELSLRPGDPIATYQLGFVLLSQGKAAEAAGLFRTTLQAKPDYEPAHFELGRALLQVGDIPGAIQNLEAAKKLQPDRDATWYQLSQAYRRAGRMEDAASALAIYQKKIESSRQKKRQALESGKP